MVHMRVRFRCSAPDAPGFATGQACRLSGVSSRFSDSGATLSITGDDAVTWTLQGEDFHLHGN